MSPPIITSWSSPPLSPLVKLCKGRDQIEATYPLLAFYAVNPASASHLTELALDPDGWPKFISCFMGDPNAPLDEPVKPVDETAHGLLEDRVRKLGLSDKATQVMLRTLAWKKAHLLGQKPDSPKGFAKHNNLYAEVASILLISYARNINHLYVGGGISWRPLLEEYLKKSNYGLIPAEHRAFQSLETVEVLDLSWHDDERNYFRLEYLAHLHYFHRLPKFRNYVVDGTAEYQIDLQVFPPKSSSPSFKRIQARHTDISGGVLGTLLRTPKGLEEVVVSMGGLWSGDGGSPLVQLKTLGKCLLDQKDTLRVIDLDLEHGIYAREPEEEDEMVDQDVDEDYDVEGVSMRSVREDEYFRIAESFATGPLFSNELPDTRKYGYTIGSFHDFDQLTHLSINVQAIVGPSKSASTPPYTKTLTEQPPFRMIDALPVNLEHFCLYGYRKGDNLDVDAHVNEFMEKKAERLPRLKEVGGIDEEVVGEGAKYGIDADEDDLWRGNMDKLERLKSWEE
ncbi:hypothetical protein CkaCkLH20_00564 [Colletotrichum karsti]|uniref:Uncharacterized protein n=1 Tax=Colletotrichum karsti TaxID=1095194 RepID=A0A9P6IEL6_9PEZI|nr:uncharacterized protein CkaCkLH20_00564 [Colletotrichum karsti]KAF9881418.1 hypothetical protein CkaCkLH20_00564 [Colletotrichum karsti]